MVLFGLKKKVLESPMVKGLNFCWPQIRRQCFVGGQDLGTHLLHTIYMHANTCDTFNFCLLCMTWEMPSDLLLTLTFDVVKAGKCTWLI